MIFITDKKMPNKQNKDKDASKVPNPENDKEIDPEVVAAAMADLEAIEEERIGYEQAESDKNEDGFTNEDESGLGEIPY